MARPMIFVMALGVAALKAFACQETTSLFDATKEQRVILSPCTSGNLSQASNPNDILLLALL